MLHSNTTSSHSPCDAPDRETGKQVSTGTVNGLIYQIKRPTRSRSCQLRRLKVEFYGPYQQRPACLHLKVTSCQFLSAPENKSYLLYVIRYWISAYKADITKCKDKASNEIN